MPPVFFKIETSFKGTADDPKQLEGEFNTQFNEIGYKAIQVSLLNENGSYTSFTADNNSLVSGDMDFSFEDGAVNVNINAIFKISVKPDYFERVMGFDEKWYFGQIEGLRIQKISGLEEEKYMATRFGGVQEEDVRYLIPVVCAQKKKDL